MARVTALLKGAGKVGTKGSTRRVPPGGRSCSDRPWQAFQPRSYCVELLVVRQIHFECRGGSAELTTARALTRRCGTSGGSWVTRVAEQQLTRKPTPTRQRDERDSSPYPSIVVGAPVLLTPVPDGRGEGTAAENSLSLVETGRTKVGVGQSDAWRYGIGANGSHG